MELSPDDPAYIDGFDGPFFNKVQCPRCFPAKRTPAPRAKLSLADQIVALAELREVGVLTDEEFKLANQKLLSSISPAKRKLQASRREDDEDTGPRSLRR